MKKVCSSQNIPIKMWLDNIEEEAMQQAYNLANLPFAFKHIALMPDAHVGYGMPIGGILATKNVVIPNAVGVDIGCGMRALRTSIQNITSEEIKKIFGGAKGHKGGIRSSIPVGYSHHSKKQDESWMPKITHNTPEIVRSLYEAGRKQIGTLGGGNHFIEIQKGTDGYIWIMIHSGSRNIGFQVAKHYNKAAIEFNEKWFSSVPKKWQLAFLPIMSDIGREYLAAMNYCLYFAQNNRGLMLHNVKEAFLAVFNDIEFSESIDIHHNYASIEHHFNENVVIHRKGATSARKGEKGIIPGSQGTASYIVEGFGNPDSFMSCSHGAGRLMSRTKARENLNLQTEKDYLDKQGIIHSIRNQKDLDEAPNAYKNITEVIANQMDLIDPIIRLQPLAVIKG